MAKRQKSKRPGKLQRVIYGVLVPVVMALSAAAFSAGLYMQGGFGLASSLIAGVTLFLVMVCAQAAYVSSQRAAYAVERLNDLEAVVEGAPDQDGDQFGQFVELSEKVGQIDEMAERVSLIDTLAERIEKLDREITRYQPDRAMIDPSRIQRLSAEIDRLGARQEALRTQLQIEARERYEEISAEVQMLEMLVKQMAENMAKSRQPSLRQEARQELPSPERESVDDEAVDARREDQEEAEVPRQEEPEQQEEFAEETVPPAAQHAEPAQQAGHPGPQPPQPEAQSAQQETDAFEPPIDELPMMDQVRQSIESNRIELFLQPIMMLPQRRVRYYEALTRLRNEAGDLLLPKDYLGAAESAGVMSVIDNVMLYRSVQVLRRLEQRNNARGVFCNISAHSLLDSEFFPEFISFMEQNRSLAENMFFEFSQHMIEHSGPVEQEGLAALAELGFRFSLDHVTNLDLDFQTMQRRGFRFMKVDADVLLHGMSEANAQIHAADMRSYLERYGIQLIVSKIESEQALANLLDYHVKLGQGYLFSEPRPVRPEVFAAADAEAAA